MEKMDALPPIPTPPAQRWREFRIQFLPLIVFVLGVVAVVMLWGATIQPIGVIGEVEVTTADVLSLQDGQVVDLTIDRFSEVKAGQTIGYVVRRSDDMLAAELAIINTDQDIMAMRELDEPRPTHLLRRGLYDDPGAEVSADVPAILPPFPEGAPRNRLGLARWATTPGHPLTSRVAANLMWRTIFGRGLVATPENFGTKGLRPTHPHLLDHLAHAFVDSRAVGISPCP